VAGSVEVIGDESVSQRRIVAVRIDRCVAQVRVRPVAIGRQVGTPPIEGLLREAQHPAGHRDRDPIVGEFEDQRVDHFWSCDWAKYAAARRRISFSCSSSRIRF